MSRFDEPAKVEWREDGENVREHRTNVLAVIECPRCSKDVYCEAETDGWVQQADGRWHHDSYGPPMGECCGLLIVDNFGEPQAYELTP